MPAGKRAAESPASEVQEKRARTGGVQLYVDLMGHDKSLELAEDCKTAAQLCAAVAEACDLKPSTFELQQNGKPVDDEAVAGLEAETRLTVRPQEEDMELVLLVLAIQDAAQKAGRSEEVKMKEGASDDTIDQLKDEVGEDSVPACVEKLLRHCDGVSFGCPQSGCGMNMASVEDILEIHGYSDYMRNKFADAANCLPWMSIDCEFAFLALDTSLTDPQLWLIDQECQSSTCFGKLADVLKAVLHHYQENNGEKLSLPGHNGGSAFPSNFLCAEESY
eukprot:TRINITY_DN1152_c0_g1_i7.p1 TRINITY_DN1152_c0_g1~~TRINITY_DN1152_c0_g1_i7.p1  ORF type:complete len:277 (+),score=89.76 TRINITY_DN1152_c0_g1_i7:52-882(+)